MIKINKESKLHYIIMSKKHENNFVLEEESSDEEELIKNTENKSKIQCEGCYYNSMNQYDHMDYGGCMYVPDCGITIRG